MKVVERVAGAGAAPQPVHWMGKTTCVSLRLPSKLLFICVNEEILRNHVVCVMSVFLRKYRDLA
jgi:hypothetical protein